MAACHDGMTAECVGGPMDGEFVAFAPRQLLFELVRSPAPPLGPSFDLSVPAAVRIDQYSLRQLTRTAIWEPE